MFQAVQCDAPLAQLWPELLWAVGGGVVEGFLSTFVGRYLARRLSATAASIFEALLIGAGYAIVERLVRRQRVTWAFVAQLVFDVSTGLMAAIVADIGTDGHEGREGEIYETLILLFFSPFSGAINGYDDCTR